MKSNVKRIARLEIPGGGQVRVHGNYAYVGHMNPPHGTVHRFDMDERYAYISTEI